jgi:hypothetical protein
MASRVRFSPARFAGYVLIAALWLVPGTVRGAANDGIRVVSATDSRIVFEIDLSSYTLAPSPRLQGTERLEIEGFGGFSEPGRPWVPGRSFLVGVPPSGDPSVSWSAVRTVSLGSHTLEPVAFPRVFEDENGEPFTSEEYRIDPAVYGAGATTIGVSADRVVKLRRQRVLPVRVVPVAYDPATGETTIATLMRVEVSFPADRGTERRVDAKESVPVPDAPVWERMYGRVLVNPSQAAKWRVGGTPRIRDLPDRGASSDALAGPHVKLLVRDTGLHRVSASSVIGKGFPSGTAVSDLKLFKRTYDSGTFSEGAVDIAFRVVEDPAGTSGVFDGNDWIVFFGRRLREDDLQGDPLEKFSYENVYWLGTSSGLEMPSVPVTAGFVSADTASAVFPVTKYFEKDNFFFDGTPPGETEFYFYADAADARVSDTFTAPSIDPDGSFILKARLLGASRVTDRPVTLSIRNSNGTTQLGDVTVFGKSAVDFTSPAVPGSAIVEGANTFRVDMTSARAMLEVFLDYFTIEYRAKYRAKGNVLEFNSADLSGDTTITVTGLTRTDVRLFDVTDPYNAREYALTPSHFIPVNGRWALAFREGFTSQKKYVLTPLDAVHQIAASDIVGDEPSGIIGSAAENGVDILVVSHEDFLGEMQRWIGYRRAQGYRVFAVDVEDVFDEFNGGVPNARAVRYFVRHFVENGGASFVVLVGDGSEDNKHAMPASGTNFVPTESFSEYVGGSFNQDEVVTTDKWYATLDYDFIANDPPYLNDYYPDVIVGRIPAGTTQELRDVLDKILEFEAPKGDDFWRRRMIRVADNAFSGVATFCYWGSEVGFENAEEAAAQGTEAAIPGGFDVVRFYLAEHLAGVEPPHVDQSCIQAYGLISPTRSEVTPALLRELNQGATMVSFQSHMNRYQLCHEVLFTTSKTWAPDHLSLSNAGRPWLAFGFGCHFSDYAVHSETAFENTNPPTGDAVAELLLLRKTGAVSTYGSSGFEFLTPNARLTGVVNDAFFEKVPTDTMIASDKAQARWIFGEIITLSEIENLLRNPGGATGSVGQTIRFHILGDPVLRVDAGPPRFQVTVNGEPFASGDLVAPDADNRIRVNAVVTDEVAIEKLALEIAGADSSGILTVTPLNDQDLSAARQYQVSFDHHIQAKRYDVILRAYQAEDTTAGTYHLAAEFVMKVQAVAELSVNGRPVYDGDLVPPQADYEFKVALPIFVDQSEIRVETDGEAVSPLFFAHPSPADTLTWLVRFERTLADGPHEVVLFVGQTEFPFALVVGTRAGLLDLIAFPNPFEDEVDFVFTSEVAISDGWIDIFTVSGKKVAHIVVPPAARAPGQNGVRWNGRTFNGDEVANGTYLFVASVEQNGRKTMQRGKLVRVK